jgi:ATPase subunit of ABC transporter with duplicated ATPase domains
MSLPASSSSASLVAHHIGKARGAGSILTDVDLTIGPTHRIGIVGPNGVGKSTLLRILAGLEPADAGTITLAPPRSSVGYLAQEPEASTTETLAEALARRAGIAEASRAYDGALAALTAGEAEADDRYADALERFIDLGGMDFEARAASLLDDLGLPTRLLELPTAALSGGQRARSALAALLLSRHDILLLDEPTNDLDFDGLERLETFLIGRRGGTVVVSHDRAFLERVVTSIVDLDEFSREATLYNGGYAEYLAAKATDRRHAEEAYDSYATERDRLKARERSQRQWAESAAASERRRPKDRDKAQRDFRINRTEKQASKVRITERAIERLEAVEEPRDPWELHLDLAAARRSGDVVVRLSGAVATRDAWQLGPIDLDVRWADRLAIVGPNGSGKSTLLATILGGAPLSAGTRWIGPSVVLGTLGQERTRFSDGTATLLDAFLAATDQQLVLSEARSLLAKFGLGAAHVLRPANTLSPGERTRAELALFVARGTNCLVLDEPTNHLDLPAIEQLESALETWEGTLLLVTHDRRLLESVRTTDRIELEGGQMTERR